jgi:hypothetical protein
MKQFEGHGSYEGVGHAPHQSHQFSNQAGSESLLRIVSLLQETFSKLEQSLAYQCTRMANIEYALQTVLATKLDSLVAVGAKGNDLLLSIAEGRSHIK